MNARSPASAVTQTWQVGPGRTAGAGSTFEDSENTLTALALRSSFRLFSRNSVSQNAIDLTLGTHSFFLESDEVVAHSVGRHPKAEFEINVYTEGGFFVDVTGRRSALVNGRECLWSRLRSGDEIQLGREKWLFEAGDGTVLEETVARTRKEACLENAVLVLPRDARAAPEVARISEKKIKAKPRAKLVVFVSMAALGMSLLSAYLGYGLAKEQQVVFVTARRNAPLVAADGIELETEDMIRGASQPTFAEKDLAAVLAAFRAGRTNEACEVLAELATALSGRGIWATKARMLFERRCR